MRHILIVDDEMGSRESLKAIFSANFKTCVGANTRDARRLLADKPIDLMLLDVMMPGQDGVAFLKEVQGSYPNLPVIMVSASTAVRPVVEAIRSGAVDYVTKPFDVEEIRLIVERTLERSSLKRNVEVLKGEVSKEFPVHGIIGHSPAFAQAVNEAKQAAETDATVLIQGESGTGKELIARLVHSHSARKDEPFVALHCGALPESLMESELFGHEKGAFTNADKRKPGRFELAGNGTLFFDEVSEMSTTTQMKLLRVLQEREYMRVGGTQVIRTNARIIAASNRNLVKEMEEKKFREDLYYRLNVVPIHIPPLRDRPEDVEMLARYFLDYFRQMMNVAAREFSPQAMAKMTSYGWPGNVRELRNIVERMLVLHGKKSVLGEEALPAEMRAGQAPVRILPSPGADGLSLEESVNAFERDLVLNALKQANGVQTRAAELLGTTRRILKYRMVKLNIGGFEDDTSGSDEEEEAPAAAQT